MLDELEHKLKICPGSSVALNKFTAARSTFKMDQMEIYDSKKRYDGDASVWVHDQTVDGGTFGCLYVTGRSTLSQGTKAHTIFIDNRNGACKSSATSEDIIWIDTKPLPIAADCKVRKWNVNGVDVDMSGVHGEFELSGGK